MAVVYLARHESLNRLVALKLIHSTARDEDRRRFRREAEVVARLQHPNIVQVYEVGDTTGWPYLALEYVEGPSLERALREKIYDGRAAADMVECLARSIHVAHRAGIVHRDLKPANVLLTAEGTPKITDFGLAKLAEHASDGATRSGQLLGTPSYVAPEQVAGLGVGGPTTAAIDVYALGAVLYEMLTGRPPFRASLPVDTLLQVLHAEPIPPSKIRPNVPRDLETICLTCLNKSPAKRYASAEALADDLRRYLDGKPVRARPLSTFGRMIRWVRRHRAVSALLAVVFFSLIGAAAGLTWLWREAELRVVVEEKSTRASQRRAAELAVERYAAMCEQGEVARGMLGLAETATTLHPEDADLEWVIRANLDAWRSQLVAKRHALTHPAEVKALAFSADGKYLATACADGFGRIWNAANGARAGENLTHAENIVAVAFHPKNAIVATASQDGTARLWEVPTGKPLGSPLAHDGPLTSLAFSPDGRWLLTGSSDQTARLWNAETGEPFGNPLKHEAAVLAVCFSPNGARIMTGSADGTARLWDTDNGTAFGVAARHKSPCRFVAISPDGSRFATGSETDFIGAAPPRPGEMRPRTINLTHPVTALAYDRTGDYIVVGGGQNENREGFESYWLPGHNVVTRLFGYEGQVDSLAVAPFARRILFGGNHWRATLLLEPYERARPIRLEHRGDANLVAFSPDFNRIATASKPTGALREGTVFLWDAPPASDGPMELPHTAVTTIATGEGGRLLTLGESRIRVWDAAGQSLGSGWPTLCRSAIWGGEREVWTFEGRKATARDAAAGALTGKSIESASPMRTMAAGGDVLAIADEADTIRTYNRKSGEPLGGSFSHPRPIEALAVSPNGETIASGDADGNVRLWTGQDTRDLLHKSPIRGIAFSPDGQWLAVGCQDKTLQIWNTRTAKPHGDPILLTEVMIQLAWHPESRVLAAVCLDGSARFWDAATGNAIGPGLLWKGFSRSLLSGRKPTSCGIFGKGVRGWREPTPLAGGTPELPIWTRRACGLGY